MKLKKITADLFYSKKLKKVFNNRERYCWWVPVGVKSFEIVYSKIPVKSEEYLPAIFIEDCLSILPFYEYINGKFCYLIIDKSCGELRYCVWYKDSETHDKLVEFLDEKLVNALCKMVMWYLKKI